jgi:hypothetical protein
MVYCVRVGRWTMGNPAEYYVGFFAGFVFFAFLSVLYYHIRFGGNNRKK